VVENVTALRILHLGAHTADGGHLDVARPDRGSREVVARCESCGQRLLIEVLSERARNWQLQLVAVASLALVAEAGWLLHGFDPSLLAEGAIDLGMGLSYVYIVGRQLERPGAQVLERLRVHRVTLRAQDHA
jgi:hypothetical protein